MRLIIILFSLFLSLTLQSQLLIFKYDQNIRWKAPLGMSWNEMIDSESYETIDIDTIPKVSIIHLDMMMVFFIGGELEIIEVLEKDKYLHLNCRTIKDSQECVFKILRSTKGEIFGILSWETEKSQFGYYLYPGSFIED